MSKLTELLSEINKFIDSTDQSNTVVMKNAAEAYCSLCNEVNAELMKVAERLNKGLTFEALNIDKSFQPTLMKRGELLSIKNISDWETLCTIYGWPSPPKIDLETISRLKKAYADSSILNPLIERWRGIIRTGSPAEKLDVLRAIIKHDKSNDKWILQLTEIEKQRLMELYEDAKNAIVSNDYVGLEAIYSELNSPELHAVPDEKVIKKIASVLSEYQKKQQKAHMNRVLLDIAEAYSTQNHIELRGLSDKWAAIASDPDLELSENEKIQTKEAFEWLSLKEEQIAREARFQYLQNALTSALDSEESSISEVERLYSELLQIDDIPVPDHISERVEAAQEKDALEKARKHKIRSVTAVLGIISVTGLAVALMVYFQANREYNDIYEQMKTALSKKQYDVVLNQCTVLASKKSPYLKKPKIMSMKSEALKMEKLFLAKKAEYDAKLSAAEKLLNEESVERDELGNYIAEAQNIVKEYGVLPEDIKRLENIREQQSEFLEILKNKRNNAFMQKLKEFEKNISSILACNDMDTSSMGNKKDKLASDFAAFQNDEVVKLASLDSKKELLRNVAHLLDNLAKKVEKQKICDEFTERINNPKTYFSYINALEEANDIDDIKTGLLKDYKQAISMITAWNGICTFTTTSGDLKNISKIKTRLDELGSKTPPNNPFYLDLIAYAPPGIVKSSTKNPNSVMREMLDSLESDYINKDFEHYELILEDSRGNPYHFYSPEPPVIAKKIKNAEGSMLNYELKMSIYIKQGIKEDISFDVNARLRSLIPTTLRNLSLPPNFKANEDIESLKQVKAAHYRALLSLIEKLKTMNTPQEAEDIIKSHLSMVMEDKRMEPFMRLVVAKKCLELLKTVSSNCSDEVDSAIKKLETAKAAKWEWINPRQSADYPKEAKTMLDAVSSINKDLIFNHRAFAAQLFYTCLSRQLYPAAVYGSTGSKKPKLVFFQNNGEVNELWGFFKQPDNVIVTKIVAKRNKNDGLYVFCDIGNDSLYGGMVLFSPSDIDYTKDRISNLKDKYKIKNSFDWQLWPKSLPVNWED